MAIVDCRAQSAIAAAPRTGTPHRGEVESADAWRLQLFAAPQIERFGYLSEDEIKADFDEAVAAGELVYSG